MELGLGKLGNKARWPRFMGGCHALKIVDSVEPDGKRKQAMGYGDPSTAKTASFRESIFFAQDDNVVLECSQLPLRELAAMATVERVDEKPEHQPDHEANPGDDGESRHESTA